LKGEKGYYFVSLIMSQVSREAGKL